MKHARIVATVLVAGVLFVGMAAAAALKDYVSKPDDSFAYTLHSTLQVRDNTVYFVQLTSQTWQNIAWKHWLAIIKPKEVKQPDKAMLLISGGSTTDGRPGLDDDEGRVLIVMAERLNAVVALLKQVPNEPLFDGKVEDGIISYTFEKYLEGAGNEWPLLLPMVKSAARAMDAIQAVGKEKLHQDIKQFLVTGASKRGWTTWLTAAVDRRVVAIAPMVIDVLNMAPQMAYQKKVYGAYSEQVEDYTARHIQDRMQTPEGKRLLDIVDPYSYRDQLTLPKVILLGTNDEYWTADSAKFYFNDLKGDKYLHYEPNAGHGLNLNIVPVIAALYHSVLTGEKLPEMDWKTTEDGSLEVTWDNPQGKASLWQAQSPNRDFRHAAWTNTALPDKGKVAVTLAPPEKGWAAYLVSVEFPLKLADMEIWYALTTLMYIVPDTYPAHEAAAR